MPDRPHEKIQQFPLFRLHRVRIDEVPVTLIQFKRHFVRNFGIRPPIPGQALELGIVIQGNHADLIDNDRSCLIIVLQIMDVNARPSLQINAVVTCLIKSGTSCRLSLGISGYLPDSARGQPAFTRNPSQETTHVGNSPTSRQG
ncbi:MAG: hypothetical protein ACN6N0_12105, partial [Microvirgula sp.]